MAIFYTSGTGGGSGSGTLTEFATAAEATETNLSQVRQSDVGICNITAVNTVDEKACSPVVATGNLSKVRV